MTPEEKQEATGIALQFFQDHPQHRDGVLKAHYAYHSPHFRLDPKAHNFTNSMRHSRCVWCGRSREDVRWDDLEPHCLQRPEITEIASCIEAEERKAWDLIEKAKREVPALAERMGLTGETLAILHHTHGFDPETVAGIVNVPPGILPDYTAAMERERLRSKAARQPKEIA